MSGPIEGTSTDLVPGVLGSNSSSGIGVWGLSDAGNAVFGLSTSGNGIVGESGSGNAGEFHGNVLVTGNLTATDVMLSGSDCAEEFETADRRPLEPGTVVVIDGRDHENEERH